MTGGFGASGGSCSLPSEEVLLLGASINYYNFISFTLAI
jgi:hypothetical protein